MSYSSPWHPNGPERSRWVLTRHPDLSLQEPLGKLQLLSHVIAEDTEVTQQVLGDGEFVPKAHTLSLGALLLGCCGVGNQRELHVTLDSSETQYSCHRAQQDAG